MIAAPVTRMDVVAEARTWLGTPFIHQARLRGVGVDCVGLPIGVARSLGLVAPDFDVTGYPGSPDGKSLLGLADQHMTRIARADMQSGDVIVIRWEVEPQHFGMLGDYLHGGLSMIHAMGTRDGRGRVIEHRLDKSMLARFVAAYALPGVT
jgi:cell wall-associated NlpC family hydrolase